MYYNTFKGEAYSERDCARIDQYRAGMLANPFGNKARSLRSIMGYKPPPGHRHVAALYKAAATLAGMGDSFVPFAMAIARAGGQYQSRGELLACAYEGLARVAREGYTDVIRLASPEPGRRKDAQRAYTLRELLTVSGVMALAECDFEAINGVPGIGWCESALRHAEHMPEWTRPKGYGF